MRYGAECRDEELERIVGIISSLEELPAGLVVSENFYKRMLMRCGAPPVNPLVIYDIPVYYDLSVTPGTWEFVSKEQAPARLGPLQVAGGKG